jgi:hypothetical protein
LLEDYESKTKEQIKVQYFDLENKHNSFANNKISRPDRVTSFRKKIEKLKMKIENCVKKTFTVANRKSDFM